jgi:hypothetical protein
VGNIRGNFFCRISRQVSINQEETKKKKQSKERRTLDPRLARTLQSRSVAQVLKTSQAQSAFSQRARWTAS